jgi:putative peptide zinc metalloprotease protein
MYRIWRAAARATGATAIYRHVLRLNTAAFPIAAGERGWLIAYAPLSWLFRCYLLYLLALWAGAKTALLGVAVALFAAFALIARPVQQFSTEAMAVAGGGGARTRARLLALAVALAGVAIAVPLPFATLAPALVWLPTRRRREPKAPGWSRA